MDEIEKSIKNAGQRVENVSKFVIKKILQKAALKLLILLKKALIVLAPFILVFFCIVVAVAAIYVAMTGSGYMTGHEMSEEDEIIKQHYVALTNTVHCDSNEVTAWNAQDLYVVPGEGRYYPTTNYPKLDRLQCHLRQDFDLRLKWSEVHAYNVFYAYTHGLSEISKEQREKAAKDLRPYFYYKKSMITIRTCCTDSEGNTSCSTSKQDIYLLVEAYTIHGHYLYEYEWQTTSHSSENCTTTITKEVLKNRTQILPDKYQRFKDYIKLDIVNDPEELETARIWIFEAAQGFFEGKEWLEWLLRNYDMSEFVSGAMVSNVIAPIVYDIADKYDLPVWLLNAIILHVSKFDPSVSGGLMGLTEEDWSVYAVKLGYCPDADRDNPRAQLDVGCYLLKEELSANIDWESDDWQSRASMALEKLYDIQAETIIETAKTYRDFSAVWPVPGYYRISSGFGWRKHPITGKIHEHLGIDIPAPNGTPVVSVSGGVVIEVGWCDNGGGNYLYIQDGMYRYAYLHLNSVSVTVGQTVQPGDKIATVGNTGMSTGSHLDLRIKDLASDKFIDPMSLLFVY